MNHFNFISIFSTQNFKAFLTFLACLLNAELWDHSFSKYARFSEKLAFLTPWYAQVAVSIQGVRNVNFSESLGKYYMNDPYPRTRRDMYLGPSVAYLLRILLNIYDWTYSKKVCIKALETFDMVLNTTLQQKEENMISKHTLEDFLELTSYYQFLIM